MDASYSGSLAGGTTVVVVGGILYKIYNTINNRKIKIMCCGRKFSASVEIRKTSRHSDKDSDKDSDKHNDKNDTPSSSSNDSIVDLVDEIKKKENKYAIRIQAAYRGYSARRRIQFERLIQQVRAKSSSSSNSSPLCILRPHSAAKN